VVTANGDYTVEITDANGCTNLSASYLYTVTGISLNGNTTGGFNLYPNPNNGWFTLSFNQPVTENTQLTIIDGIGQVVYQQAVKTNGKNNTVEIRPTQLARGTYTVVITDGQNRYHEKLVVNY
jgi:hypothetical protein